ncbi:MAG: hypothetical protein V4456_06380 [Bacteroidota bacterium]
MKKLLFSALFTAMAITAFAQKVETFTINNNTYYGTKAIPAEIVGHYSYEKDGDKEPIVDVNKDGTGKFQVHDVPAYPVEFWIETDATGKINVRKSDVNANYQMVLVLKYGSNGESGWRGANAGTYDRIEVTVAKTMGYAIILGERYMKLR